MDELGYVPDAIAQSLRTQSTVTVGCIVPDISFPAFSNTIGAAEERLRAAGYTMQVMATQELRGARDRDPVTLQAAAIFGSHHDTRPRRRRDHPAGDRQSHGAGGTARSQTVDADRFRLYRPFPRRAAGNGISAAARAPAYRADHSVGTRLAGARTPARIPSGACRDGAICNPAWIVGPGFESDHAYKIAYDLLTAHPRPTAIMAGGFPTIGVMRAARSLGISIPQELSLISFGDTDFADLLFSAVDSRAMGQPRDRKDRSGDPGVADRAATTGEVPTQVVLPSELVVRGSCASLRVAT